MKIRALGLLLLLALILTAPVWSLGPSMCTDDCSPERGCSYACGCCPCCQLPVATTTQPEIRLAPSAVAIFVQPPGALPSPEPRAVLHVPRPS
ncbi:MAG TPA: hypothetical protein VGM86_26205 [Thermoanaerobaculia bacterium]|jgi:hypothetical protein